MQILEELGFIKILFPTLVGSLIINSTEEIQLAFNA